MPLVLERRKQRMIYKSKKKKKLKKVKNPGQLLIAFSDNLEGEELEQFIQKLEDK